MMKRYGSIMATLAVGMLAGGVFGAGCGTGGGEACLTNADCTVPGETCIANAGTLGTSTCGCDPTAATDSCTEADADTICHPDRGACELSCETDDDCTTSGETCDIATKACRAPDSLGCTTDFDCTSPDVCDTDAKTCVAPCTATSCTTGEKCNDGTKLCEPDCTLAGNECAEGSTCDTASGVCVEECGGNTCTATQVCDTSVNECVERCSGSLDCTGTNEVCDTGSGLCLVHCDASGAPACEGGLVCNAGTGLCGTSECTVNADCTDGDKLCISGVCEAPRDISTCTGTDRQYVKFETNACTPTAGNLDTCLAAEQRTSRLEVAAGPTIYAAERTDFVTEACDGGTVYEFFADYYDATGGVAFNDAGFTNGLYGDLYRSMVGASDSNVFDTPEICGFNKTDGDCEGIVSDTNRGRFIFKVCQDGDASEPIAVYMSDKAGNFGNSICIDLN